MDDRPAAQDLRWKAFETTLDIGMLRDHVAHLPDFAEFDALDKAFAHANGFEQKYRALAFFLGWPRLDLAAKLVVKWRAEWEGRYYAPLLAAAEALEPDHRQRLQFYSAPFSTISSIALDLPPMAMRLGILQNSMRSRRMKVPQIR